MKKRFPKKKNIYVKRRYHNHRLAAIFFFFQNSEINWCQILRWQHLLFVQFWKRKFKILTKTWKHISIKIRGTPGHNIMLIVEFKKFSLLPTNVSFSPWNSNFTLIIFGKRFPKFTFLRNILFKIYLYCSF
jgi:hypothetical protein